MYNMYAILYKDLFVFVSLFVFVFVVVFVFVLLWTKQKFLRVRFTHGLLTSL